MGTARQAPQGATRSQREEQLGFESDMGEFVGNNGSAKNL